MEVETDSGGLSKDGRKLLGYMNLASSVKEGRQSAVDDFASSLLRIMDYDTRDRMVRTRYDIAFFTCGVETRAQTDICVIADEVRNLLLLVQEDKRLTSSHDPEPQVIAEAIRRIIG